MYRFDMLDNKLSIGYNLSEQAFFDVLNLYRKSIHSVFYGPGYGFRGDKLDPVSIVHNMSQCNTYDIPLNILFNDISIKVKDLEYWTRLSKEQLPNVTSVTLISVEQCKFVRNTFPDLKIHLSVRIDQEVIDNMSNDLYDVVNISGVYNFNDFEMMNFYKDKKNKLVKILLNEGCIPWGSVCMNKFKNYETARCGTTRCGSEACRAFCEDYPYMNLARVNIYNEMIPHYNKYVDIYKITSREISSDKLKSILDRYFKSDKTSSSYSGHQIMNYEKFLEWIPLRLKCDSQCYTCGICKKYYTQIFS